MSPPPPCTLGGVRPCGALFGSFRTVFRLALVLQADTYLFHFFSQ